MKYLIASLLSGEVEQYHRRLCAELARRFDLTDPCKKIPPYFTLKAPFESDQDQIKEVEKLLANLARRQKPAPMGIANFGHFGDRVVYLNIIPSKPALKIHTDLIARLRQVKNLKWDRHDGPNRTFHATLVRPKSPQQFREIIKFLTRNRAHLSSRAQSRDLSRMRLPTSVGDTSRPVDDQDDIKFSFDNIALLRYTGDKWAILKRFDF